MSLAVEGAANTTFSTPTASGSLNMTTGGTNRIIVVAIHNSSPAQQLALAPTSSGLTFTRRSHLLYTGHGSFFCEYAVWWAYAAAQLTAQAIAINMNGTCDDVSVEAFAVSGVDSSRFSTGGWDNNLSLPAFNENNTGTNNVPSVSGISTTDADTMLLFFFSTNSTSAIGGTGAPSGFTRIGLVTNSGGTFFSSQSVDDKVVSAPQSGITITSTISGIANWGAIADAITSDAALHSPRHRGIFIG